MDCLINFVIRLNILLVKKLVLQIVLIIILERSELIHIILCQLKTYWLTFHSVIVFIKSVVDQNKIK